MNSSSYCSLMGDVHKRVGILVLCLFVSKKPKTNTVRFFDTTFPHTEIDNKSENEVTVPTRFVLPLTQWAATSEVEDMTLMADVPGGTG